MRARSAVLASVASGAILLIGWQAGNQPADSGPRASAPTVATPSTPSAPAPSEATVTGNEVRTPYGTMQVKVRISGGRIADVIPVQLTDRGSTSTEIDRQAVPMLKAEVLSSQSATVDTIGGATYTSEGYLTSLQAALDSAHFGG